MKLLIPLLGKTRERYLEEGIQDFAGRLSRFAAVEMPVLRDRHSRHDPDEVIRSQEAELLLTQAAGASLVVALDPGGSQPDSLALAGFLTAWEDQGLATICFLIGGHLGLHPSVLNRSGLVISLSRLTFTHEMTRLILLEQLYRAWTIKAGHKYHK